MSHFIFLEAEIGIWGILFSSFILLLIFSHRFKKNKSAKDTVYSMIKEII